MIKVLLRDHLLLQKFDQVPGNGLEGSLPISKLCAVHPEHSLSSHDASMDLLTREKDSGGMGF